MEDVASIVGAVSGCLSLIGLIYMLGIWRGRVDAALNDLKKYPPGEMWTMTRTLWDVYVLDALRNRPDLAEHGSAFTLKQAACDIIPDWIKPPLDAIPLNPAQLEDIATGYLVVKHIGRDLINQMAEEQNLSVQEVIAILSTYLDMKAQPIG